MVSGDHSLVGLHGLPTAVASLLEELGLQGTGASGLELPGLRAQAQNFGEQA